MSEPIDDGLVIPEVGAWAKRKYHFLGRYLEAFNIAMKDKKWTGGRHYIDLFSGSGIARIRSSGELVWSSPMLAAQVKHPFARLHLCDENSENTAALRKRLDRFPQPNPPCVYDGDANKIIEKVISRIPTNSLSVAFVDPFGLHFDFESARALSKGARADLVVLLADNMDALRNWSAYYESDRQSTLDRFLGTDTWRDLFNSTPVERKAQVLRELYQSQLETLGYTQFGFENVQNAQGRDIYKLLFACKHKAGLDIWNGISEIDEGGQRRMFS